MFAKYQYLSTDAREEEGDDHGPGLPASTCLTSSGSLHLPYLYMCRCTYIIIHNLMIFYKNGLCVLLCVALTD